MDITKIHSAINALPVRTDGKRQVANLVQELINTLTKENVHLVPKQGEVWMNTIGRIGMVTSKGSIATFDYVETNVCQNGADQSMGFVNYTTFADATWLTFVATNPAEYYANRATILNDLTSKYGNRHN